MVGRTLHSVYISFNDVTGTHSRFRVVARTNPKTTEQIWSNCCYRPQDIPASCLEDHSKHDTKLILVSVTNYAAAVRVIGGVTWITQRCKLIHCPSYPPSTWHRVLRCMFESILRCPWESTKWIQLGSPQFECPCERISSRSASMIYSWILLSSFHPLSPTGRHFV